MSDTPNKAKIYGVRIAIILAIWLCVSIISALRLSLIHSDTNFIESMMVSFSFGFLALPLSLAHLVTETGDGIIRVGGRPMLLLYAVIYWIVMVGLQIFYVKTGRRKFLIPFALIALFSAPYCAYYAFALIGI